MAYAYQDMEKSAVHQVQNLNRTHEMHQSQVSTMNQSGMFGKPDRKMQERREELEAKYNSIKEVIGIENLEGESFENFLNGIQTLRDLERVTFQKLDELDKARETIEYKKAHLETLKKAQRTEIKDQEEKASAYEEMDDREELKGLLRQKQNEIEHTRQKNKRLAGLSLDVKMLYADIGKKLGIAIDIESMNPEELAETDKEIIEKAQERLTAAKEHVPEEEFESF
mmetsp:Transcript_37966/g.33997  ORF Transcript_37966/g.33997 Transcript_37966/m.33997 type:complete len:226 (+) Transcript_37966:2212-2889(+)|eukprot:CAMPEP_0114589264 /NCGR_PEP_ID=MMETSP0125-20121206/11755_1 /TAXON_ID=485358 ORGANISM="Aristerostoma sp., Strain ATCC 50986" /NCGR_SAMPLE_ID=MMETSP0125 /ASSEMBLY_ACC=CAM_ASM_000245 /LENGTH=225 /DNA_ID=CAMNT_0001786063 /DNA_START=3444 /DNA_END=4121 /DNA_ORIENTATION=-